MTDYLGARIVFSPDLEELCESIGAASDAIVAAGMFDDPEVRAVAEAVVKAVYSGSAFDITFTNGDAVFSIADDELLGLLAKWQAFKRVAIARLQQRGWRT